MNKMLIVATVAFLVVSCRKEDSHIAINGTGLIAKWQLTATSVYGIFGQGPWQIVAESERAIIEFKVDSSFTYDNNFPFKAQHYDRFKTVNYNTGSFILLYSSFDNLEHPGTSVKFINDNEIILAQHSIDTGVDEKYVRIN